MEQLSLPNIGGPRYLMWFDNQKKYPMKEKIADALYRYEEKFGNPATLILIHPEHVEEARTVTDIQIEGRSYIGRFLFYVGEE